MGACLSSYSHPLSQLTAKVITLDGKLHEYSIDVTVSQVLQTVSPQSCFLCDSDKLYYDEFIQALSPKEELEMGQMYFILPSSRLRQRLTAQDMAALAVKASKAIGETTKKGSQKRKKMRISPVLEDNRMYNEEMFKRFDQKPVAVGITRSGSVRKLQRNASKRAKMAIRSFRLRLSTIPEEM